MKLSLKETKELNKQARELAAIFTQYVVDNITIYEHIFFIVKRTTKISITKYTLLDATKAYFRYNKDYTHIPLLNDRQRILKFVDKKRLVEEYSKLPSTITKLNDNKKEQDYLNDVQPTIVLNTSTVLIKKLLLGDRRTSKMIFSQIDIATLSSKFKKLLLEEHLGILFRMSSSQRLAFKDEVNSLSQNTIVDFVQRYSSILKLLPMRDDYNDLCKKCISHSREVLKYVVRPSNELKQLHKMLWEI